MKVGVFTSGFLPTQGGLFTFQDDVARALAEIESRHTFVIFSESSEQLGFAQTSEHLKFISLGRNLAQRAQDRLFALPERIAAKMPLFSQDRLTLKHTTRLDRLMVELKIDFLWFLTFAYVDVDIPFIYIVWDLQHRIQPWFPEVNARGQWAFREQWFATAIRRASAVITGTESGKAEIMRFYGVPQERVKLIPHPTPRFALDASKERDRAVLSKYGIPEGYLFYPANFWAHKNHVGLLMAIKLLRDEYGLVLPVVFVGSDKGNLPHVRRTVSQLGLSGQVHLLGFVPRQDLVSLYQNALALTYMTFFGPENLPPLEAFALGCPVIASRISGAEEQLGDAALLVDPVDERQTANAIKLVLNDPIKRETLVSRGRTRALKWTAVDFVRSVSSLIDEFEPIRRCWNR